MGSSVDDVPAQFEGLKTDAKATGKVGWVKVDGFGV